MLIPWLVRSLSDIIPIFHLPNQLWITTNVPMKQACTVVLIEMFSVFSLIIAFRYFLQLFFKNPTLSMLLSFTLLLVLPFNYLLARYAPFWYPYDIPGQFFFVLGIIFLYKEKWLHFYILFAIATFNRETSAFLTLIFLFTTFKKIPLKIALLHCLAQGIIWLSIKMILYQLYGHNQGEGTIIEQHLGFNMEYLKSFKNYPLLFSNFGFLWIPILLFYKHIENVFIKRCLLVFILFFVVQLFTSSIPELRVYQEFIPIIITAYTCILKSLFEKESFKSTAHPFH